MLVRNKKTKLNLGDSIYSRAHTSLLLPGLKCTKRTKTKEKKKKTNCAPNSVALQAGHVTRRRVLNIKESIDVAHNRMIPEGTSGGVTARLADLHE